MASHPRPRLPPTTLARPLAGGGTRARAAVSLTTRLPRAAPRPSASRVATGTPVTLSATPSLPRPPRLLPRRSLPATTTTAATTSASSPSPALSRFAPTRWLPAPPARSLRAPTTSASTPPPTSSRAVAARRLAPARTALLSRTRSTLLAMLEHAKVCLKLNLRSRHAYDTLSLHLH